MNVIITSRHFDLTDSIKSYIENLLLGLEKYSLDIISARGVVSYQEKKSKDKKKQKRFFELDISIFMAKANTVVVSQRDKDLYTAADLAIARVHKILRRYHDRINHKHAVSTDELMVADILRDEAKAIKADDEIVAMDLDLHKPMDIEEALERLKSSSQQFFVFNDKDSKMRVIYKRIDGKYGLY